MASSITFRDREVVNPFARIVIGMLLMVLAVLLVVVSIVMFPVAWLCVHVGIPGFVFKYQTRGRYATTITTRGRPLFGRDGWALTYTFS